VGKFIRGTYLNFGTRGGGFKGDSHTPKTNWGVEQNPEVHIPTQMVEGRKVVRQ